MNKTKKIVVLGIVAVLFAVLTVSAASAQEPTLHFVPQDSSVPEGYCNTTNVEIWLNIPADKNVAYGQFGFSYDPLCGNIASRTLNAGYPPKPIDPSWSTWNYYTMENTCWNDTRDWVVFKFWWPRSGEDVMIGNFTIHCNSTEYCANDLNFGYIPGCPQGWIILWNESDEEIPVDTTNGTFECGEVPPPETFEKELVTGWNLISLCFEPSDGSTSAVLSSIWDNVTTVKEWDASSHNWVNATTMDRGKGYFVHVTQDCTWNHTGMNKTNPMTIPLEPGLNLVGYPFNWSKDTGDALSALNYYYTAPFDATDQKYDKTFNPVAPAPFNDFTTINPCEGFWVSSKDGDDWTAS